MSWNWTHKFFKKKSELVWKGQMSTEKQFAAILLYHLHLGPLTDLLSLVQIRPTFKSEIYKFNKNCISIWYYNFHPWRRWIFQKVTRWHNMIKFEQWSRFKTITCLSEMRKGENYLFILFKYLLKGVMRKHNDHNSIRVTNSALE